MEAVETGAPEASEGEAAAEVGAADFPGAPTGEGRTKTRS